MRIGLDKSPAAARKCYFHHLAGILERHAERHEYFTGTQRTKNVDLYHGFRHSLPLRVHLRQVKTVLTVPDLFFLRYPERYPLVERLFVLTAFRRALRSAERVIALNTPDSRELSQRLGIPSERIEVVLPLGAAAPERPAADEQLEVVRRKYALPEKFMLSIGTIEPRRNHEALFEALLAAGLPLHVVICGRRTAYADFLLGYARSRGMATHVEFIYEPTAEDLPALFRLATAYVHLPDAALRTSIVPTVEALRTGLPLLLSDTALNRETASDAALYVDPEDVGQLAAAIRRLTSDRHLQETLRERARHRAELFSEYAVAQRLIGIYSSL